MSTSAMLTALPRHPCPPTPNGVSRLVVMHRRLPLALRITAALPAKDPSLPPTTPRRRVVRGSAGKGWRAGPDGGSGHGVQGGHAFGTTARR
jgi:hypothetical protein